MNCRRARRLMHEVLDGDLTQRPALDEHLGECRPCRTQWARLQRVQDVLAQTAGRPLEPVRLQRLTRASLAQIGAPGPEGGIVSGVPAWMRFACAGAVMLAFAVGLVIGRSAWPTEVVVTRTVPGPEIVGKTVRVQVPVVEERVVVKPVPVVKTRVVYRDRPTPTAGITDSSALAGGYGARELPGPGEVEVVSVQPVLRREIEPAAVVERPVDDIPTPEPAADGRADLGSDRVADSMMVAHAARDVTEQTPGGNQ